MIKRVNKLTSGLLAAASVISLVPSTSVFAADYKRISSEDGTIYNAVAYKDGTFYLDGDINDKEATYFLNNGKYNKLDDIDTGSDLEIYGEKYINFENGDYFLDLSNGKVTDDDIEEDNIDDASTALRRKIKDVDRYGDDNRLPNLEALRGPKFSSTWYMTKDYTTDSAVTYTTNSAVSIFTDSKGNYIDADYNLGKIKVTTKSNNTEKNVNIENTKDTYDAVNGKDAIKASLSNTKVLGQDSSNIYRLATITVSVDASKSANTKITEIYGMAVDKSDALVVNSDGTSVTFKVIQKISKAQASDDVDDAKYAKTVNNYVLANDKGQAKSLLTEAEEDFTISNGKVTNYKLDGNNIEAVTLTLKSKNGFYYTDFSDGDDQDLENAEAYDVDANGNLWALNGGFVYKYDNDDSWDKVYKVDGSMEEITVYDDNNLVVWNEDDEVYSIISAKSNSSEDDNKEEDKKAGWDQNSDGTWVYYKNDGTKATGWLDLNGQWYYLNSNGTMATGWVQVGGQWYYLNPISYGTKGAMKTGWVLDNGHWYYLNPISNGYRGAMQTGWVNVSGTWYYLNPISDGTRGAMKTGWINDRGTWYYLYPNGAMAHDTTINGYRLGSNGAWIR